MDRKEVSLNDKYNLEKSPVLMNGTQALVRLERVHGDLIQDSQVS